MLFIQRLDRSHLPAWFATYTQSCEAPAKHALRDRGGGPVGRRPTVNYTRDPRRASVPPSLRRRAKSEAHFVEYSYKFAVRRTNTKLARKRALRTSACGVGVGPLRFAQVNQGRARPQFSPCYSSVLLRSTKCGRSPHLLRSLLAKRALREQ